MKKYTFNNIMIVNGIVEFFYINQNDMPENFYGEFSFIKGFKYKTTKTIREFLNCLQKTIIRDDMEYSISEVMGKKIYETSFDCLLNFFVEDLSKKQKLTKKEIISFYKLANKIKENAINERQILNKIPKEFIK